TGSGLVPVQEIGGVMSGSFYVPYLDWDKEQLLHVVATLAAGFFLVTVMLSFQRRLPTIVHDLVGNRQVAALGQYTTPLRKTAMGYVRNVQSSLSRKRK
ncbi:MAG: hypothetical protein KDD76_06790, partial [Rickettsiales bacterium]|nr:hypothetical protein [Rickettsiales bacterium]